jgi:hypothetical protein
MLCTNYYSLFVIKILLFSQIILRIFSFLQIFVIWMYDNLPLIIDILVFNK